jgi:hypothetical protein
VGRRERFRYRHAHEEVLRHLAPLLVAHSPYPKVFSVAMGDYAYFLRHPDLETLQAAIAYIEEQA